MTVNYWEKDDIDLTSWEVAMKAALKRATLLNQKEYVWAYKSKRNTNTICVRWAVTDYPPSEHWDEAFK